MPLIVRSDRVKRWLGADDPFKKIQAISGKVVRCKEGRTTQRFEIDGYGYYVKYHQGVGWREIIKNLLQLRLPIIGASNEWLAIDRLHKLGIHTMDAVAFDKKGSNPATQHSFVMTKELTQTLSLAKYCETWVVQKPLPKLKRAIINEVATIARTIHSNGMNHRDLYICHFLLSIANGVENIKPEDLQLHLVDLHRVAIRSAVPERWLVKDIASLYFSSMDIGLNKRDIYRFIVSYTGLPLRQALENKKHFWISVQRKAHKLYWRDWKKAPNDLFV
ncbi:lipopolysaccharide core heptose(I) kinase RfaP [bacterium AH-315-K03]|nr:lipopolysaccharide core heptose(I) kinase RfaP [bacterium AH-315-K03]